MIYLFFLRRRIFVIFLNREEKSADFEILRWLSESVNIHFNFYDLKRKRDIFEIKESCLVDRIFEI